MNYSCRELSLNNDEKINMILSRFIPIPEIRKDIINKKKELEKEETLEYYKERWNNIIGYYFVTKDTKIGKFSQILDGEKYIIKPDHRLEFFERTGISYQIIELLHELLLLKSEEGILQDNSYEYWLQHDDTLYSKMSKMIMIEMKNLIRLKN
tara:strand:+ start:88 stop:546 length:459 start_codon:yes stop_codon:yes gene_type:complete